MRAACAAVQLALTGCASTATLTTSRGTLEATILGGDDDALLVMNEAGSKRRVLREDVREIDHPGNVLATIFGISAGILGTDSITLAATGVCGGGSSGGGNVIPCAVIGGLAAVSLGFFALGLWQWLTSRNAVFNPPPASEGPLTKFPFAFPSEDVPGPLPPALLPPPPPPGL